MPGGFEISGFASVMPTLVMFQLCGDILSLGSLIELRFSKTLLVDF
jgi:hypothetical protein